MLTNGSSSTSLMIGIKRQPLLLPIKTVNGFHKTSLLNILFLNISEFILNNHLKDKYKIQLSVFLMDLVIVILQN